MCKKLILLVSFAAMLGLVSSAPAVERDWVGGGDNSWCGSSHWSPSGVPGPDDEAGNGDTPPVQGPIIGSGCNANVGSIGLPSGEVGQVMEITGGTLVCGTWRWCNSDDSTGTVTISGGDVNVIGDFRCADSGGTYGIMNFTGGLFYCNTILIGDDGSGEINISGSASVNCRNDLLLACRNDGETATLNMDGGMVIVGGTFGAPSTNEGDDYACDVNLHGGTIICNEFSHSDNPYSMDIDSGALLMIKGDHMVEMVNDVDLGYITGNDETEPPIVVFDGEYTCVGFDLIQTKAWDPSPTNGAGGVCPGGLDLTWLPGENAEQHKVFFGASWDDVNSMTDPCATKDLGDANYAPGPLEYGKTYYWRVDEVNITDPCTWRGSIWSFSTANGKASDPSPMDGQRGAIPSSVLTWIPACRATGQKLYFGTDFPETIVLFDDDFESGLGQWDNVGWVQYNAGGDANFAPHDNNLASATGGGVKTLTSDDIDASDYANALRVSFYVRTTEWMAVDELQLYYYNGSAYNLVDDFNVVGLDPNGRWVQFTDTITDSNYLISNFRVQLVADISSGTVYVDDVTVTNTWPVDPFWLEADLGGADNNRAPTLSTYQHYYWRVDTTDGGDVYQGDYWDFTTGYGGLLLELLFEGNLNDDLPETVIGTSDNHLEFTKYTNVGSVKYAGGRYTGTSADFDPNAGLYRLDTGEFDPLRLDSWQYTIQFWVKPERLDGDMDIDGDDPNEDWLDNDFAIVLIGKFNSWMIGIQGPGGDNDFEWDLGNDETEGDAVVGEWTHLAAIYDRTVEDDQLFLYINGELESEVGAGPRPSDNNYPVTIGYAYKDDVNMGRYFEGCIDELRIWDIVVLPVIECATQPYPENGSRRWEPNDANLVTFMWTPGAYAANVDGHNIYFGDSLDDVNESADPYVTGHDSNSWTHGFTFEIGRTYYWRVDEVNGTDVWTGFIWKFQMEADLIDPNIVVYYPLDETGGDDVLDYSGRYFDADCDNDPHWKPDNGRYGGCMHFSMELVWDDDEEEWDWGNEEPGNIETESDYGAQMAALINKEISICVWVNGDPNQRSDDDMVVFEFCDDDYEDGINGEPDSTKIFAIVPTEGTGNVVFRAGLYPQDTLTWTGFEPLAARGTWQHFVFIKNDNDANMYIYLNNELVATKTDCNTTSLADVNGSGDATLKLGAFVDNDSSYHGRLDEFQIYNKQLNEQEIEQIFRGGELGPAWSPSPGHGQGNVSYDTDLTWKPGAYVADTNGHEVYFGTNYNEVFGANSIVHPNVVHDTCSVTSFDPGILELEQTYYWRVDEVNEANDDTWKGRVWRFTVADYIGIDDMEDYTEGSGSDYPIAGYGTRGWDCGFNNDTGSYVSLGLPSGGVPVRDKQSMVYVYMNDGAYYSEISNHFPMDPCDWTYADVKMLTLWFYGDTGNDADETEQMYVGLEDSDGNYAEVRYPMEDMDNIRILDWTEWNIALSDFNYDNPNLNLTDVNTLYIGFGNRNSSELGGVGTVYFDDIRLYPPVCIPSKRPEEFAKIDFNNDCIVDFGDVEIMAEDWLKSDVNLGEVSEPCDANLVGWWMLDEGSGSTAYDSSDYGNDGTIEVIDINVWWVAGRNDVNYALEFDDGRVLVSDAAELKPMHQVSACAWIYYSDEQDSGRIVVKGADNKETYDLEVGGNDELVFLVRDGNDPNAEDYPRYDAKSDDDALDRDEWIHAAGTYDGNSVKCYINGEVVGVNNDANAMTYFGHPLSQDTNDLAIGNRPDAMDKPFKGIIDDVRVYNYGLSAAEVAYLATDGGHNGIGIFRMQSVANLYTGEPLGSGVINLRDFAKLAAGAWLEEKLWPE